MIRIKIDTHKEGTVTCANCPFHEETSDEAPFVDVSTILSDGAMHAMESGHHVHEDIHDIRDVWPLTTWAESKEGCGPITSDGESPNESDPYPKVTDYGVLSAGGPTPTTAKAS